MDKLFIKVIEDALSDEFQAGYEEENGGLKNALVYFAETIVSKMSTVIRFLNYLE